MVLATVIGFIGLLMKQPLIVSFIAVGLIAGPSVLDIVHSKEQITLLSELGIAILLFLVGIKLDVKLIRSIGGVSLMTGLGQVAFTSIAGYFIGLSLDLGHITSLYVAVALTFSSTIIIVKLLSDKKEIDSLHGQIALGFLIVQDLVVVLAMIVLAAIGIGDGHGGTNDSSVWNVALSGGGLLLFVIVFVRYIANPLTEQLAKIPELLVIYAIAQAALFAAIGDFVGLVTLVGIVTIAASTYMITYSHWLYSLAEPLLGIFEREGTPKEQSEEHHSCGHYPIIIFGLGRLGTAIAMRLKNKGFKVLGIDFSPETIKHWNQLGLDTQYGDVTDAEFITELPLRHAQWIVSTIPYHHTGISSEDTRKTIIQLTRVAGFSGKIATVSHSKTETEELKILGIDLVFEPFQDAADRASELLLDGMDIQLSKQK